MQSDNLTACRQLIESVERYLSRQLGPHEFETAFLSWRRKKIENKEVWFDVKISDAMDGIFSVVDRFYDGEDPDEIDLSADQLYEEVYRIWNTLKGELKQ